MRRDKTVFNQKTEGGFTLIEIAIVVVIIGLLLGGILKGQEMIRNARAHNVANQGNAIKASILGFQDRFRALPGDYNRASDNMTGLDNLEECVATATDLQPLLGVGNGDGNSRIGGEPDEAEDTQTGCQRIHELAFAWRHLSAAGFLSGNFDGDSAGLDEPNFGCRGTTCLTNAFNGGLILSYSYGQFSQPKTDEGETETPTTEKAITDGKSTQLNTGRFIPVEIIAELDRKVDDGDPSKGSFRIADFFVTGEGTPESGGACTGDNVPGIAVDHDHYNIISQNTDCGGVYLF